MGVVIQIGQLLLSLSILIILHELGHFLFARLFNTRVEKFYLFFDPWFSIFKLKRGDTEYGIGWLPLGGYVKISGMIDESMDREQLKQPAQPWEFRSKSTGQRLLIMLGGVVVNLILGFIIYSAVLFTWGEKFLPAKNLTDGIWCVDSIATDIGFRNGDKILSVDNQYIEDFNDVLKDIILNRRSSLQIDRNGEKIEIALPAEYVPGLLKGKGKIEVRTLFGPFIINDFVKNSPAKLAGVMKGDELIGIDSLIFTYYDEFQSYVAARKGGTIVLNIRRDQAQVNIPMAPGSDGKLGISADRSAALDFEFKTVKFGFFQSIPAGIARGFREIGDYLKQFRLIFSKDTKAYESLGGFITIGSIFPTSWDMERFLDVTAFLSIILAIMNILPIPALDGGHVMFVLYEIITGRKPSDKFLEYAQIAGMIILFSLLIFANGNDILRWIRR